MNKINVKSRNSNLEILRILAMLFIIADHWAWHGFDNVHFIISNVNTFIIYFPIIFGQIGVDIFVLISAYFMVNSKFTFRKFMMIGGEVYFYSIIFLILFSTILTPVDPINFYSLLYSIFPICLGQYWFITHYIILMIMSPFLNRFIKSLDKEEYLKLILLLCLICCLLPTFSFLPEICNRMVLFIVLYFIGGFIRLHLDITKFNTKKLILIFGCSIVVIYSLYTLFCVFYLQTHNVLFDNLSKIVSSGNCIFVLLASLSLFLIFLKRKGFSNNKVNYIAGSVFGVYLIHNNIFARPYIWKVIFNNPSFYFSSNLVLFGVVSIIIVYVACTIIDIFRRLTIDKLWLYIIDNKLNFIPIMLSNKFKLLQNKFDYYFKV